MKRDQQQPIPPPPEVRTDGPMITVQVPPRERLERRKLKLEIELLERQLGDGDTRYLRIKHYHEVADEIEPVHPDAARLIRSVCRDIEDEEEDE